MNLVSKNIEKKKIEAKIIKMKIYILGRLVKIDYTHKKPLTANSGNHFVTSTRLVINYHAAHVHLGTLPISCVSKTPSYFPVCAC